MGCQPRPAWVCIWNDITAHDSLPEKPPLLPNALPWTVIFVSVPSSVRLDSLGTQWLVADADVLPSCLSNRPTPLNVT